MDYVVFFTDFDGIGCMQYEILKVARDKDTHKQKDVHHREDTHFFCSLFCNQW